MKSWSHDKLAIIIQLIPNYQLQVPKIQNIEITNSRNATYSKQTSTESKIIGK